MAPTSDAGGGWSDGGTTSGDGYRHRVSPGQSVSEAVVAAVAAATGRPEVVAVGDVEPSAAGTGADAAAGADGGVEDGGAGVGDGDTGVEDGDAGVGDARTEVARADVESGALAPLYETVDPDALDALFRPDGVSPVAVTFTYSGREVTVEGGEVVRVLGG